MSECGMHCGEATSESGKRRRGWHALRALLFVAGLTLVGYIDYRYSFFQPPDHGTVYGVIFPLSALLALAGMVLAFRPYALARVPGQAGLALRSGITAYGGVWMATGMMCASSLARGAVKAPLGGSVDLLHMLLQHVFLPLGVVALAWAPERVARWTGAPEEAPAGDASASEPVLGTS